MLSRLSAPGGDYSIAIHSDIPSVSNPSDKRGASAKLRMSLAKTPEGEYFVIGDESNNMWPSGAGGIYGRRNGGWDKASGKSQTCIPQALLEKMILRRGC